MKAISVKGEEGQQRIMAAEMIIRQEWERIISDKLQKEFAEKRSLANKSSTALQEQMVLEIIAQLEVETRDTVLSTKLTKRKESMQFLLRNFEKGSRK
jgi:hypothetical protein